MMETEKQNELIELKWKPGEDKRGTPYKEADLTFLFTFDSESDFLGCSVRRYARNSYVSVEFLGCGEGYSLLDEPVITEVWVILKESNDYFDAHFDGLIYRIKAAWREQGLGAI